MSPAGLSQSPCRFAFSLPAAKVVVAFLIGDCKELVSDNRSCGPSLLGKRFDRDKALRNILDSLWFRAWTRAVPNMERPDCEETLKTPLAV